jgi:hypothetical protein
MVFSVTPSKVFAHAKGDPFGATSHRFRRGGQIRAAATAPRGSDEHQDS